MLRPPATGHKARILHATMSRPQLGYYKPITTEVLYLIHGAFYYESKQLYRLAARLKWHYALTMGSRTFLHFIHRAHCSYNFFIFYFTGPTYMYSISQQDYAASIEMNVAKGMMGMI